MLPADDSSLQRFSELESHRPAMGWKRYTGSCKAIQYSDTGPSLCMLEGLAHLPIYMTVVQSHSFAP